MTAANTNTDLRNGVNGDVGCKYPCDCATTANIDLEGLQTIDSVVGVDGQTIVLVKNQTDQSQNGVYLQSTGEWQRGIWFNNQLNVAPGTLVVVNEGSDNARTIWEVVCADNPIDFDTSDITFELKVKDTNTGDQTITLTGDVTGSGTGSFATTISDNAVTNAKLANVPTATFKGRATTGTGAPEDLTSTQATDLLDVMVGDSGSGGIKGLVPAPVAGDGAANKFLRADGAWTLPSSDLPAEIIIYANDTPPSGYLECNGAAISRTTYLGLFLVIGTTFGSGDGSTTFNIPDLRGYFVRGWDNGRGIDPGRSFGSNQTDALQNITGEVEIEVVTGTTVSGAFALNTSSGTVSSTTAITTSGKLVPNFDASRIARTAIETRSINIALMVCIKY